MGRQDVIPDRSPEGLRRFAKRLLVELQVLEKMFTDGLIESGVKRIGAEQEVFLVDRRHRPSTTSGPILARINDPHFTTELAKFNLEVNLDPLRLGGRCFSAFERELDEQCAVLRAAARDENALVVLTGILPTLSKSDLTEHNITPVPRYFALNDAMHDLRGGPFHIRIEGAEELRAEHASVMFEACNASFQVHLQVDADEFPAYYNMAQAVLAPTVAVAANSPFLLGKQLWAESRIALFQQSVDTRRSNPYAREQIPRVRFGEQWVKQSVVELFRDDVARFPVLVALPLGDDPEEQLANGVLPELRALQLFNSTVYRWNRACYGVSDNRAHLRIECRAIPSGPSVIDEVANAAFWIGLVMGGVHEYGDITRVLDFEDARAGFVAAARYGLRAGITWPDCRPGDASHLIRECLLPLARAGLEEAKVNHNDIDRYLGVIEGRVESGRTGASWLVESCRFMKRGTRGERMLALTAGLERRQREGGHPVHEWDLARIDETRDWQGSYQTVEQFMNTDLFTVDQEEPVEMVAFLMDEKQLRHVLVENEANRLVGIVSYRSVIRLVARGEVSKAATVPISEIMETHPLTVSPDTSSIEAIELMRERRVSALPVLDDGHLVGLVTERAFMEVAQDLLMDRLRFRRD